MAKCKGYYKSKLANHKTFKAIDEILDLVSSREPDEYIKKDIRWGHDTDCGTNDDLHIGAYKILKKYGLIGSDT